MNDVRIHPLYQFNEPREGDQITTKADLPRDRYRVHKSTTLFPKPVEIFSWRRHDMRAIAGFDLRTDVTDKVGERNRNSCHVNHCPAPIYWRRSFHIMRQ